MTTIIDGKAVSQQILAELKQQISKFSSKPGLAVILVGDNPASQAYIRMKKKACEDIGIQSFEFLLPKDSHESELEQVIQSLLEGNLHPISEWPPPS